MIHKLRDKGHLNAIKPTNRILVSAPVSLGLTAWVFEFIWNYLGKGLGVGDKGLTINIHNPLTSLI